MDKYNGIVSFLRSIECETLVFSLTTVRMLRAFGVKSELRIDDIRSEMKELLRLKSEILNEVLLSKVNLALFDHIDNVISNHVTATLTSKDAVPPRMRAALIKANASMATAALRNTELCARLDSIAGFTRRKPH